MPKIADELAEIRKKLAEVNQSIQQLSFRMVHVINQLGGDSPSPSTRKVAVDFAPIEKKLDELSEKLPPEDIQSIISEEIKSELQKKSFDLSEDALREIREIKEKLPNDSIDRPSLQTDQIRDIIKEEIQKISLETSDNISQNMNEVISKLSKPEFPTEEIIHQIKNTINEIEKKTSDSVEDVKSELGTIRKELSDYLSKQISPTETPVAELKQILIEVSDEIKKISSKKVVEADKTMEKATRLLEKGLQLVELEGVLREIKNYLLEITLSGKTLQELQDS